MVAGQSVRSAWDRRDALVQNGARRLDYGLRRSASGIAPAIVFGLSSRSSGRFHLIPGYWIIRTTSAGWATALPVWSVRWVCSTTFAAILISRVLSCRCVIIAGVIAGSWPSASSGVLGPVILEVILIVVRMPITSP